MRQYSRVLLVTLLAVATGAAATGCSGPVSPRFGGGPVEDIDPRPAFEEYVPDPDPPDYPIPQFDYGDYREDNSGQWTCVYSVTFNDDWHDDVLCSNGSERVRPYLREWDSFVTEDEMWESAKEYEDYLNSEW